jgi:hypothetical protein
MTPKDIDLLPNDQQKSPQIRLFLSQFREHLAADRFQQDAHISSSFGSGTNFLYVCPFFPMTSTVAT